MSEQYEIVQEYIKQFAKKKNIDYRKVTFQDILAISIETSNIYGEPISMDYILQSIGLLAMANEKDGKK